jgi:hypothetical protein
VITFTQPLTLPDRPILFEGAGTGVTELQWTGGQDGIVGLGRTVGRPVTIRDLTISTNAARSGSAIKLTSGNGSSHDPSVIIERIVVKGGGATFRKGITLDGCWMPRIDKSWIYGQYSDVTVETLNSGTAMSTAIDVGASQEAKISNTYIACAATGVSIQGPAQGTGEGIAVSGCAIINNLVSIRLNGGVYGGWATPWAVVRDSHLFYLETGVFVITRADVVISGNSICGSHLIPNYGVGIYIVGASRSVRVCDNHVWTTKPGQGYGIIADASNDGVIGGNVIDASVYLGIWLTASSQGWDARGNRNRATIPVIDNNGGNLT